MYCKLSNDTLENQLFIFEPAIRPKWLEPASLFPVHNLFGSEYPPKHNRFQKPQKIARLVDTLSVLELSGSFGIAIFHLS